MSTPKPDPVPTSILPRRLQDGSYAPWVCTYDSFGVLIRCEGVNSIDPAPEGSFVFPIREDLGVPLRLGDDANVCGGCRVYDPAPGVWLNEDGTITPPPVSPG